MGLVVFSVILFLIAIGGALFYGSISKKKYNDNKGYKFVFLTPLVFLVLVFGMFTTVNANEVGIVYDPLNGGLQETSYDEGLHFKAPWVKVTKISTKLREASFEVTSQTGQIYDINDNPTGGGQFVTYEVTLQYKVTVVDAFLFYKTFGQNEAALSTLEARVRESLQDKSTDYDVFSILKGALNDVRLDTEENLRESLSDLGIYVDSFIIRDVDAGDEIEQVVENEATAAKEKEIAIKEQEAALIREETEKLKAEIEAERVVIEATAAAEAQIILNSVTVNAINEMYLNQFNEGEDTATPEIYGYLSIQEISEVIIKQLYYDTWDGTLPTVITDGSGIIIQP